MKEIKRVYIAGPITPIGNENKSVKHLANIRNGVYAGIALMEAGFSPYNPFLDFMYWLVGGGDGFFLSVHRIRKMDLDWVEVSDAMLLLKGWKKSVGARGELDRAKKYNIPYFESIDDLVAYRDKMREDGK